MPPIDLRKNTYFKLNTQLSSLSDAALLKRLNATRHQQGWGLNQQLRVDKIPVFVKRVPLTEREQAQTFSTRNHYRLPTFYNYGIGSAGFGAFRELLTHIKTSNWVLSEQSPHFPLLYHYRILRNAAPWKQWAPEALERQVAFWNRSQAVKEFLLARMQAEYEVVLFLEYVPHSLHSWLTRRPLQNLNPLVAQTQKALAFLNQQGVCHLDSHFANLLTDGEQVFVSDFGLALDQGFELSAPEKRFWSAHQHVYDQAQFLSGFGYLLLWRYLELPVSDQTEVLQIAGINLDTPDAEKLQALILQAEKLQQALQIEPEWLALISHWRELMLEMRSFYSQLRANPRKNTPFAKERIASLLNAGRITC